jgi:hypothetical protein
VFVGKRLARDEVEPLAATEDPAGREGEAMSVKEAGRKLRTLADEAYALMLMAERRMDSDARYEQAKQALERYAREAVKPLVAELERIGSAINDAAAYWDRQDAGSGGINVPFHGDFADVPPSTKSRLRWHGRNISAALAAWKEKR